MFLVVTPSHQVLEHVADPAAMLSQVCVCRSKPLPSRRAFLLLLILVNAQACIMQLPPHAAAPPRFQCHLLFHSFICDIATPFILSCIQSHFSLFANADTLSCAHAVFGPRSSRRQCFCVFDQQDRIVLRAVRSPPSPPPSSLLSASSCIVSTSSFEHRTFTR